MMRPRLPNRNRFRSWIEEVDADEVRAVAAEAIECYDAATPNRHEPPPNPMGSRPDLVEAVRARLIGRDPEALLDACEALLNLGDGIANSNPSSHEQTWAAAITLLRRVMYVEAWWRRTERQRAQGICLPQ